MAFMFSSKVDFLFGQGASEQLGEQLVMMGCKKALFIYDKGVKQVGIIDPIVASVKQSGVEVIEFGDVQADPPDTSVNECAEVGRSANVDSVVGIGGGSTMDTAKAVNVLLSNPGKVQDYFGSTGNPHKPSKPLILLPTTSGTASEVTYVSVITDSKNQIKDGLNGPATIANLAIIDPLLTKGMPASITASTGMDTLAHALEAYTTNLTSPMSDLLAERAIELVIEYLPKACANGNDMEAREQMSFACLLAGESFNNALVHFGHAFGQGFGAIHHVPHGTACAIGQPIVAKLAAELFPAKARKLAAMFGLELGADVSDAEVGEKLGAKIRDFGKSIGIPSMADLGIKETDLEAIAKKTMADGVFNFMPKPMELDEVLASVKKLYAEA